MVATKASLALTIAADGNLLFSEKSGSGNLSAGSLHWFKKFEQRHLHKNYNNYSACRFIYNWSNIVAGNILAILVLFAKSTNIFLCEKIALYGRPSMCVLNRNVQA